MFYGASRWCDVPGIDRALSWFPRISLILKMWIAVCVSQLIGVKNLLPWWTVSLVFDLSQTVLTFNISIFTPFVLNTHPKKEIVGIWNSIVSCLAWRWYSATFVGQPAHVWLGEYISMLFMYLVKNLSVMLWKTIHKWLADRRCTG